MDKKKELKNSKKPILIGFAILILVLLVGIFFVNLQKDESRPLPVV